jgi:hypothetical protein
MEEPDVIAIERQSHPGRRTGARQGSYKGAKHWYARSIIDDAHPFLKFARLVPGRYRFDLEAGMNPAAFAREGSRNISIAFCNSASAATSEPQFSIAS